MAQADLGPQVESLIVGPPVANRPEQAGNKSRFNVRTLLKVQFSADSTHMSSLPDEVTATFKS